MNKLRIAILGASGIGKFHAREFKKAGAEVVAILGSNNESAKKTSDLLLNSYQIHSNYYSNLNELLEKERPDAVSVCTPSRFHFEHVSSCLEAGVHVLSEKPLVLNSDFENTKFAKELIKKAAEKEILLTVNTQWPSVIDYFRPIVDLTNLKKFSMLMQPRDFGKEALLDQLPHMNSILVKIIPYGVADNVRFMGDRKENIEVIFDFVSNNYKCEVNYKFKYKESGQRDFELGFNGETFRREVDESYKQSFVSGDVKIEIPDPLTLSINKFVNAIKGKDSVPVSSEEIIANITLQDKIIEAYTKY